MNKETPKAILTIEEIEFILNDLASQDAVDKYFKLFPVEPKVTATQELEQSIALDLQCEDKTIGKLLGE